MKRQLAVITGLLFVAMFVFMIMAGLVANRVGSNPNQYEFYQILNWISMICMVLAFGAGIVTLLLPADLPVIQNSHSMHVTENHYHESLPAAQPEPIKDIITYVLVQEAAPDNYLAGNVRAGLGAMPQIKYEPEIRQFGSDTSDWISVAPKLDYREPELLPSPVTGRLSSATPKLQKNESKQLPARAAIKVHGVPDSLLPTGEVRTFNDDHDGIVTMARVAEGWYAIEDQELFDEQMQSRGKVSNK